MMALNEGSWSRSNEQQYVQSGMSKVFIYEPEKRVTVKELLQDDSPEEGITKSNNKYDILLELHANGIGNFSSPIAKW
jgi:hypothetical protein